MTIDNINLIDQYPENYDDWDAIKIQYATDYMNEAQALSEAYYNKHEEFEGEDEEQHLEYLGLFQHSLTSLAGSKNAYATLGIMMEYNWPGHERVWFPATRGDAETYAELQENEGNTPTEEGEEPVRPDEDILLDYGDVM